MGKYLNFSDALVIGLSAYIIVFGANYFLRSAGMSSYQA